MTTKTIAKRRNISKKCSLSDCDVYGKIVLGYCHNHYMHFHKYGNPYVVKNYHGEGATPEARFWSRVALTANDHKCWEWQGTLSRQGYGKIRFKNRHWRAHRLAWFLVEGYEAKKMLLHSCDNPKCVNPKHLREGTAAENMRDMVERERQARGVKNAKNKLSEQEVLTIDELLKNGFDTVQVGRIFNVATSTISRIKLRKSWTHILDK